MLDQLKIDSRIRNIVTACDIRISSIGDAYLAGARLVSPDTLGVYYGNLDLVALSTPLHYNLTGANSNLVLLHEIGHWTGHSSRLARQAVVDTETNEGLYRGNTEKKLVAVAKREEATAHTIMKYLALYLGLDALEVDDFYNAYISGFDLTVTRQIERDSDQAVDYVFEEVSRCQAA